MSTTSIVPTAIDAAVTGLRAGMTGANAAVTVHEAWPGPDGPTTSAEMLWFGQITWPDYKLATIKAGRQYRDETFHLEWQLAVFGADGTTPADPSNARDRAFAILAVFENLVADDPRAGISPNTVQWLEVKPTSAGPRIFEKAWGYRIAGVLVGRARLT